MDSGNSGSISSSGDEEYDSSRAPDQTILPPTFLNQPPTHFGNSISSQQHLHHDLHSSNLFDLSPTTYNLHSFPQSQNSLLNLEGGSGSGTAHHGNCTDPASIMNNQSNLLGLASQDNNNNSAIRLLSSTSSSPVTTNVTSRNSKKRTRASRRAPTTVLTTDTTNFRSMVQEFTGIPAAPPFSAPSYSSRGRFHHFPAAGSSNYLDAGGGGGGFYPFRPSPQKVVQQNHPFPFSSSSSSRLLNSNIMVDAFASNNTNVSSSSSNNNYQLPHHDLGLQQYQQQPVQNMMLSMQNHSILGFNPSPLQQAGFGAKSQTGLSMTSFEDMIAAAGAGVSVQPGHEHVVANSEGMPIMRNNVNDDGCGDGSTAAGPSL